MHGDRNYIPPHPSPLKLRPYDGIEMCVLLLLLLLLSSSLILSHPRSIPFIGLYIAHLVKYGLCSAVTKEKLSSKLVN